MGSSHATRVAPRFENTARTSPFSTVIVRSDVSALTGATAGTGAGSPAVGAGAESPAAWGEAGYQPLVGRKNDESQQDCEKKTAFHRLRDRIQTRAAKRVAAEDALEAHPSATERAVSGNGFGRILRTRRQVAARARK